MAHCAPPYAEDSKSIAKVFLLETVVCCRSDQGGAAGVDGGDLLHDGLHLVRHLQVLQVTLPLHHGGMKISTVWIQNLPNDVNISGELKIYELIQNAGC